MKEKRFGTNSAAALLLLVTCAACGTETDTRPEGLFLKGEFTQEEAALVERALEAFRAAGLEEPRGYIRYLHSAAEAEEVGLLQSSKEGRTGGYVRGWVNRAIDTAYVRAFGDAGPHQEELTVHELLHLLGYDHGDKEKTPQQWQRFRNIELKVMEAYYGTQS